MRKIRKLLSFLMAVLIIVGNISPAFADDFVEYEYADDFDSYDSIEYEDNYGSDEDVNFSESSGSDRSSTKLDDVIEIKSEDQERPVGYVKLTFSAGKYGKIKNNKSYYVKKGLYLYDYIPKIQPKVTPYAGYTFRKWDFIELDNYEIYSDTLATALYAIGDDGVNSENPKVYTDEKPPGYVEVKFKSGEYGYCQEEKTLYVDSSRLAKLYEYLPQTSYKKDYEFCCWSKDIGRARKYCYDITVTPKYNEVGSVMEPMRDGRPPIGAEGYVRVEFYGYDSSWPSDVFYVDPNDAVVLNPPDAIPRVGYEFIGWDINPRSFRQYKKDTKIKAVFHKYPDIVPLKAPSGKYNPAPTGYVTIKFKAFGDDDGYGYPKLEGETIFYVNPNAGVYLKDLPIPKVTGVKYYKWYESLDFKYSITGDSTYVVVGSSSPSGDEDIETVDQIEYEYEPPCIVENENDEIPDTRKVYANINLHGLKDKDFEFSKIYPHGQELELRGEITDSNNQKKVLSKKLSFDPNKLKLYYRRHPDIFFEKSNHEGDKLADVYLTKDPSDCGKIFTHKDPPTYDASPKVQTYTMDIYQTQNTYLKFDTLDKDNKPVENPTFGKFTYKIGDEVGNSVKNIPTSKEKLDAYKENYVNLKNKEKFNGTNKPEISLDKANKGGFIYKSNDDFAYKILKTKQDSLSDPLEVTLVKKQKVIIGNTRPKIKDESGSYVPDDDYVKVDFKAGENVSIVGNNPIYWVLKDVDLDGKIKAPKVKAGARYALGKWEPEFSPTNQKYTKDTTHICQSLENMMDVLAKVKLHGLKGKDFEFSKIYPKGQELELKGEITENNNQKKVLSKKLGFDPGNLNLDFGKHSEKFFINPNNAGNKLPDVNLTKDPSDFGKIFTHKDQASVDNNSKTVTYNVDIYQTQNTYFKFNTIDKDGNDTENPNFGSFTYKIGDEVGNSVKNIPVSKKKFDAYKDGYVNFDNKEKFDGRKKPEISLDNTKEGGFIYEANDDFAYKILKIKQKNLSDPLEVILVKKQKVIQGDERPKIKDENGRYVPDNDYVKVDFKAGEHSTIEGDNPVYWVLKNIDLESRIKAPKVKTEHGYGLNNWKPVFSPTNQKYSVDTTHIANIEKIDYLDILTYSGDKAKYTKRIIDKNKKIENVYLVDEYGLHEPGDLKSEISLDNEQIKISLTGKSFFERGRNRYRYDFEADVNREFGDKILTSPEKLLKREAIVYQKNTDGNKWFGVKYTIKNQNAKGIVSPQVKETIKNEKLSKEDILDAVKNGNFSYNNEVPYNNKKGANALNIYTGGKSILNPAKAKLSMKDEDYNKIDFSRTGQQEVPVTIRYFDNSESVVNVKINIKEVVPTGFREQTHHTQKILLSLGLIGIFVCAINFKKKFLKI